MSFSSSVPPGRLGRGKGHRRSNAPAEAPAEAGGPPAAEPRGDDDTRLRILHAAGPIFARYGFERATVRRICLAAGVNVAAVGYYFGDKMGLYLEVIRGIRARRETPYPLPDDTLLAAEERLYRRIFILLSRMMVDAGEADWEAQLMMREMHQPTAAFDEMVQQYFRPMFAQLNGILAGLTPSGTPQPVLHQLAFSIVGQCLYHRIGAATVRAMVAAEERQEYFNLEALARHITGVTLAAAEGGRAAEIAAALPTLSTVHVPRS